MLGVLLVLAGWLTAMAVIVAVLMYDEDGP